MIRLLKITRVLSICLLFITGINALIAGMLFIIDPTGKKMGMTIAYLTNSPFTNYLIPGITLFVVNGIMNILVAILSLKKYKHFISLIILQGVLLSGWIIIQVMMVRDFNSLHFIMLSIGIILIISGLIQRSSFKIS